ncbi:MAG: 50S ribosomal protein L9 [Patescibacteria group bacterium]|nr:50S ribosomal protein L9 [Patescibacteria group bacterium]MDE1988495.1 50S ribosomal protein L9 [Patescibacteria group bacterium]MDE2218138.1 50S ribosomal protein L9 [Patescibacteria group bacterium]
MKIILLKDVKGLGKKYDFKEAKDGHALNLLIPQGLAVRATDKNIKEIGIKKKNDLERLKIQEDLLIMNLKELDGIKIEMTEKANEKGHLFASIRKEQIIPEIKKQAKIDMLPEFVILEKPIKEVGEHEISVKVADKTIKFKLVIKGSVV